MDVLSMWTIYDHPRDMPDCFVARRWEISGPEPVGTSDVRRAAKLEELRDAFRDEGLVCIPRDASDDPVIIETWL